MKTVGAFCDEEIKNESLLNMHSGKLKTASKYL